MENYIEIQETYTIDKKEYKVIARTKREENTDKLYDILSGYVLQKLKFIN